MFVVIAIARYSSSVTQRQGTDLVVGNKMHKAFSLPVEEFTLPEEVPTASEEKFPLLKKNDSTAVKIALLPKSKRNCQSKTQSQVSTVV
nr:hypothetical protein [Tanacetum cinerariifolium]